MKDEALRLALEALKTCQIDGDGWSGPHYDFDDVKVGKAIIAIRQALEQPVATNDTSKDRVDETAKQRHEPEPVTRGNNDKTRQPMYRSLHHLV